MIFQSHRWLIVCLPACLAGLIAAGISWSRWPVPEMHDDFGNLLVAKTLLLGRWSNPTPPAYEALESFHVICIPRYAAKFPIGPGALMAMGEWAVGDVASGLWLASALATAACVWMLLARLTARWSMGLGLLMALHPSWQCGWSQSYTHGWLPVAGVAFVLGGVLRIRARLSPTQLARIGIAIAIGCVLVLFSRPFDAGVVCGLLGILMAVRIVQTGWFRESRFWMAAIPSAAILLIGIVTQLTINTATTGYAWKLPYQLHEEQYGVAPLMVWSQPHEPSLGHRFREQEVFHRDCSMESYRRASSWLGYCDLMHRRLVMIAAHWGAVFACVPLGIAMGIRNKSSLSILMLIAMLALLTINAVPWVMPAYVAGLIPIALLLTGQVLRQAINRWMECTQRESPSRVRRAPFEWGVLGLLLLGQSIALASTAYARATYQSGWEASWADRRMEYIKRLNFEGGKHLVFVEYDSHHDVQAEWVYNDPEPEKASIVWARFSSDDLNERVENAYPGRRIWKLTVGDQKVLKPIDSGINKGQARNQN